MKSKYKDNPSLNLLLEKQAFKRFSEIDVDADGLINFEETFSFANTHMTPPMGIHLRNQNRDSISYAILTHQLLKNLKSWTLTGMAT